MEAMSLSAAKLGAKGSDRYDGRHPLPEVPASWPLRLGRHMLPLGGTLFKPVELEIELFCRGLRVDPSCEVNADGRRISRTRAGLGSGLELVLPSPRQKIWVN